MRMWRCQQKLHMMMENILRPRQFKEGVEVPSLLMFTQNDLCTLQV